MASARRVGCTASQAEDVAQDVLVAVLERGPRNVEGYARVVGRRLAVQVLRGLRAIVSGEVEVGVAAEQEEHVAAVELAFSLRVRSRGRLGVLVDADGSRGRMARLRARNVVEAALSEAPPFRIGAPPGWGAGSPHAGRGTPTEKIVSNEETE